jgi:hypothetical protein
MVADKSYRNFSSVMIFVVVCQHMDWTGKKTEQKFQSPLRYLKKPNFATGNSKFKDPR